MEPLRVLIVEDNPVDAISLKEALEEAKDPEFSVSHVETIAEAKEHFEKEDFNVVVLDLGLPDSQGIETFIQVQKLVPDIPVVVLSGLDDKILAMEAVAKGAQDYLLKDRLDSYLIVRSLNYAIERYRILGACRQAERVAQRKSRALTVLSRCNEVLVRAEDEVAFLNDICRIIVESGEYQMAWVGYPLHDEAKKVKPIAVAGFENSYLKATKITWSDDDTGRGPTGTAIRTGTCQINRTSETNPLYGPWRSEALKRGYASSIALPLIVEGETIGALTMYSGESHAFDEEEVELLSRLADDVSYGIVTIRSRAEKDRAEKKLRDAQRRLDLALNGAEDFMFIKDKDLRFVQVNTSLAMSAGLEPSEFVGRTVEEIGGFEIGNYTKEIELRALGGQPIEGELTVPIKGIAVALSYSITPLEDADGNISGIFGIARDVTDRKPRERDTLQCAEEYPSKAIRSTLSLARRAAEGGSTVLLLGESGSGKDYHAKYIHDHSARVNGPYLSVNCAAITPTLAESELFGHEKGAFTGAAGRKRGMLELAEGGTLLLNEIGELSLPLQAKLLTFLDTKKFPRVGGEKEISVNVRLIAATNRDLKKEVDAGRFRQDLFYRINVMAISVPPLRERLEDIPILVREILANLRDQLQIHEMPIVDLGVISTLKKYDWPGNVRELRNVLERALILSHGKYLELEGLRIHKGKEALSKDEELAFSVSFPNPRSLNEITKDVKRFLIDGALRKSGGTRQDAARLLGISRDSLKHYMKTLGYYEE